MTLHSSGLAGLGIQTTLAGGTLAAPNGVAIGVGDNLVGSGTVDAKVAAGFGSTIAASGDLVLGDADSYSGFTSDGELYVNGNTVTIHDKNQVVLGALTEITGGTLAAANGLLVEFGKNVTGRGTIDTPNDPAKVLLNNGMIAGDSFTEFLTLTGYVKGVGTFDNFSPTGTFSPGLSPTEMTVDNMILQDSSILIMELGGTSARQ